MKEEITTLQKINKFLNSEMPTVEMSNKNRKRLNYMISFIIGITFLFIVFQVNEMNERLDDICNNYQDICMETYVCFPIGNYSATENEFQYTNLNEQTGVTQKHTLP